MKKTRRKTAYDDLALIPAVTAESVLDQTYTGSELGALRPGAEEIVRIESARLAMSAQDREEFITLADQRCRDAYAADAKWFMDIARAKTMERGPGQLQIWMSHWLSAYLTHPDQFRQTVTTPVTNVAAS